MRNSPQTVLVTGGAGFIGSHTCIELLRHGHDIVVIDDYSNSSPAALRRVEEIAGRKLLGAHEVDVRNGEAVSAVFARHQIDSVIHFAARKAVGESVLVPLDYYDVNIGATVALLQAMIEHGVHDLVFSSSCSIYGEGSGRPLREDDAARPTNPYARSKWFCEGVIEDACHRHPELSVIALRYFNPIGAHPSGLLGEDPPGVPNNVMPYMMRVAIGRLHELTIFGDDYPTADGTCVRDYLHVVDVADAHRVAVERLAGDSGLRVLNLGTGLGTSVRELVAAFSHASGIEIPYRMAARRPGDVATLVADPGLVAAEWGWEATRGIAEMCGDAWRFQRLNPDGLDAPARPAATGQLAASL
jgi:UDP-glucose 4-epimerase